MPPAGVFELLHVELQPLPAGMSVVALQLRPAREEGEEGGEGEGEEEEEEEEGRLKRREVKV